VQFLVFSLFFFFLNGGTRTEDSQLTDEAWHTHARTCTRTYKRARTRARMRVRVRMRARTHAAARTLTQVWRNRLLGSNIGLGSDTLESIRTVDDYWQWLQCVRRICAAMPLATGLC
jgi:hypothetical protein